MASYRRLRAFLQAYLMRSPTTAKYESSCCRSRVPLCEAYNNIVVVSGRKRRKAKDEFLQRGG